MGGKSGGVEIREKSIRLSFTVDGVRQRPTIKIDGKPMAPTPANIKYANRLLIEIGERIRAGSFSMVEYFPDSGAPTTLTVGAWLDKWLNAQRVEKSTRHGYVAAVNFWKRAVCDDRQRKMGDVTLRGLKLSHVLTGIANHPNLSGKTINNYVSALRQGLALALADNLIAKNVTDGVPRAKHQRQPPDPFSREEAELIIAEAAKVHPQIQNLIETWFWTGLRTSEINGLEWPYVDFKDDTIGIERVLVSGEEKDRTKTAEPRLVRMNSRSRAALQRQRALTQMAGGRVFQDPRHNEPFHSEEAFQRVFWARILKRLGIRYRRPYNMRHTYATSMLMAGMTPAFCARQLGHTVEMFLRIYTKWIDGSQNDLEMARLESAIQSPESPRDRETGS
ncbi:Arm DNA-binding domain-containing protein [Caballeronia sp. LZ035]|uniref:Arm DNA-binding domain-containing protein n=1 Tax=Caballeronia sp. LZ035 TaxID=3038568 RepID=UPI00285858B4|nr:DUF3596 domain-containing protein [Caballeronia sp. LZ035]MDR5761910.1 DUF3596 domain-containing protein [Caballeronia sp. LZ035]